MMTNNLGGMEIITNHKNNLFLIDASTLLLGIDFEVITDTIFKKELIEHFYKFEDHEIEYELVTILGLGVVKNLNLDNDYYIYNASDDSLDNFRLMNEVTRLEVYYQITHPDYDNKQLEKFILGTERGKKFLMKLQTVDSELPYNELKRVFENKKGNIFQFR